MTHDTAPAVQMLGLTRREFGWFRTGSRTAFVSVCEPSIASDGCVTLILAPLGIESQGSSASLDALELALVSSGHVVIRVEPPGTGNAADNGEEGPEWEWVVRSGIDIATASAARWPGRPLVILGVQLGAAAAVEVADAVESVSSIVAWAPTVNGRKFLRALKIFGAVATDENRRGEQSDQPVATLQVGGYSFGPGLQESIARDQPKRAFVFVGRVDSRDRPR